MRCARRIATSASRADRPRTGAAARRGRPDRSSGRPAGGALLRGRRAPRGGASREVGVGGVAPSSRSRFERAREARDRRVRVRGGQREPAGAQPERGRTRGLAAALEVLGDHRGRLLAAGEEPRREQPADPRVALALRPRRQRARRSTSRTRPRANCDLAVAGARAGLDARGSRPRSSSSSSPSSSRRSSSSSSSSRRARIAPPSTAANRSAAFAVGLSRSMRAATTSRAVAGTLVAGLAHRLRELLDEQRVAAAARDHGGDVERRRRVAEPIGDQRAQLATDEVADRRSRRRPRAEAGPRAARSGRAAPGPAAVTASVWRSTSRLALSARWMSSMT